MTKAKITKDKTVVKKNKPKAKPKKVVAKNTVSNPRGRPVQWTGERKQKAIDIIFEEICVNKRSVTNILTNADRNILPTEFTFYGWLLEDEELAKKYARVMEIRAHRKFDSIEEDYNAEPRLDPETGRIDNGWVQYQKLKIDAKKFEIAQLAPKKYGAKMNHTIDSKSEITITDAEEREKRIKELLGKMGSK